MKCSIISEMRYKITQEGGRMKRIGLLVALLVSVLFVGNGVCKDIETYYVDLDWVMDKNPELKTSYERLEIFQKSEMEKTYKELKKIEEPLSVEPLKSKYEKYVKLTDELAVLRNKVAIGTLTKEEEAKIGRYALEIESIQKDLLPILEKKQNVINESNKVLSEKKTQMVLEGRVTLRKAIEEVAKEYKNGIVIERVEEKHLFIPPDRDLTNKIIEKLKNTK